MKRASSITKKSFMLIAVGLTLVLIAAACAGRAVSVTNIPIPTTVPPSQASNTPVATTASALQILPTDTGQADPAATATSGANSVSFSKNVLPIFQANCTRCHGPDRQAAGLDFSSYTSLMGGNPVIVPNDPNNSMLLQAVTAGIMPRGGQPLSAQDIQTITDWINAGAPNN